MALPPSSPDWVNMAAPRVTYPDKRKKDRPPRAPRTPAEQLTEILLCAVMGPLDLDLFTRSTSLAVDIGMNFADVVELTMELEDKLRPFLPGAEIEDEVAEGWHTVGDVIAFVETTLASGY